MALVFLVFLMLVRGCLLRTLELGEGLSVHSSDTEYPGRDVSAMNPFVLMLVFFHILPDHPVFLQFCGLVHIMSCI